MMDKMDQRNSEVQIEMTDEIKNHLRILYLYQLLLTESDQNHMLSTMQIREKMQEYHGIYMHRTTVPSDIAMLRAAGMSRAVSRRSTTGGCRQRLLLLSTATLSQDGIPAQSRAQSQLTSHSLKGTLINTK